MSGLNSIVMAGARKTKRSTAGYAIRPPISMLKTRRYKAMECDKCGNYTSVHLILTCEGWLEVCEDCTRIIKQEELKEEIYK